MHAGKAEDLGNEAICATLKLRSLFASSSSTEDMMDTFWCLQDWFSRLVDLASDDPGETLRVVQQTCPRLIADTADLLSFTSKTSCRQNAAIQKLVRGHQQFPFEPDGTEGIFERLRCARIGRSIGNPWYAGSGANSRLGWILSVRPIPCEGRQGASVIRAVNATRNQRAGRRDTRYAEANHVDQS